MLRLIIVSSLVAGPNLALGFPSLHSPMSRLTPHTSAAAVGECVDFSGEWVGSCKDSDGKSYEERMTLSQDGCAAITSDNETMKLGSVKTETEADANVHTSVTIMPEWNSDKTAIKAPISLDGKGFNTDMPYRFKGEGSFDLRLDGDSLVSVTDFSGTVYLNSGEQKFANHATCTYTKAN